MKRWQTALILLAALALRAPQLIAPLWYDEAFTWAATSRGFSDWIMAISNDVHPVGFYVLERVAFALSSAPIVLRMIPLAFGLLAVWLAAKVAEALEAPPSAQALAALAMAAMPQMVYYSAEVRMYSMLTAFYLLGIWCVLARRWWWFPLTLLALVYTHNFGWIYAATLGALALWSARGHWWRDIICPGLLPLPLYLPALALLREQLVNTGPYWANLSLYGVAITPALWLAGAPLSRPLLGALLLVGSMALVMAAVWRGVLHRRYTLLWLIGAPLAIALALSPFKNIWLNRAFIGSGAALAVLMAVEFPPARFATLALPLLLVGALTDETRPAIVERYATPAIAAYIRQQLQPGDAVLCLGSGPWMELQPYRLPVAIAVDESGEWLSRGGLSNATRLALGARPLAGQPIRIWIVEPIIPGAFYTPAVPAGADLVAAYVSPEQGYKSRLYLLEAPHVYTQR